jgi:hypothetical protein
VWINPPAKKSTAQDAQGLMIAVSHDLMVEQRSLSRLSARQPGKSL